MDDDYYIIDVDNQEEKKGTLDDECEIIGRRRYREALDSLMDTP